jgi:hypothetical protein
MTKELLPCPFCGSSATMEQTDDNRWSVGCDSADELMCMGNQSFATFSRQVEARDAWNKRTFTEPQTAASPEISRLIAKSDEQTTALDQIMTTAADNLAAANSDLKMTLEFIHHVAEYTLAVTRPEHRAPSASSPAEAAPFQRPRE